MDDRFFLIFATTLGMQLHPRNIDLRTCPMEDIQSIINCCVIVAAMSIDSLDLHLKEV